MLRRFWREEILMNPLLVLALGEIAVLLLCRKRLLAWAKARRAAVRAGNRAFDQRFTS